jgi:hypothetical protein
MKSLIIKLNGIRTIRNNNPTKVIKTLTVPLQFIAANEAGLLVTV